MKKLSRTFLFLLIVFLTFGAVDEARAEVYNGKLYDVYHPNSGFTVFAEESNRWMDYNSWMIKSSIDSRIYYCIDPALALGEAPSGSFTYVTGEKNIIGKSNLTKEKYDKVRLLSYYGYNYKNGSIDHTSKKWYGITQVMIWRVMRPDLTWIFKADRYSTPDKNLYKEEVLEMNRLVANHGKVASFKDKSLKLLIGESVTLTDTNKVLENFFRVNALKYVSVSQSENKLVITANKQGKEAINYSFRNGIVNQIALLTSNAYQDILVRGILTDLPYFAINVEVTGGVVNLQKIDGSTNKKKAQGEATLKGAIYEVYDENNKIVGKITTDKNGQGKIILDYGKYKLKEINAPEGYNLSDEIYEFELNTENTEINLEVKDKVISGKVLLTKNKGGSGEKFSLEKGAVFEVLDSFGNVVEKLTTNENGTAEAVLPYGNYTIHQVKGSSGYVFVDDVKLEIRENKIYEVNINNLKLSKLEFTKTDKVTGKRLANTLIEVCKDDDTLIYTGKTNKNGIIEVSNLEIGKYYILEKEASKYYRLNKDRIYFEVNKNGQLIKINMKNERKKGTLEFYKIDSLTGEKLANVLIKIVSSENNKEVFKGKTDKNGKILVNNLEAGKYCIYEEKALRGYLKTDKSICFELENDDELVRVSMTNEKFIKVPNTYKNSINIVIVLGTISIIIGVIFVLHAKKKD